jgi:hypothetical protein
MHAGVICGSPNETLNGSQYITLNDNEFESMWKIAVVV